MRLLVAAHGFPPTHAAGAEHRAERLATWMAAQGHHVEVFALERLDASAPRLETRAHGAYPVHRFHCHLGHNGQWLRNSYAHPHIRPAVEEVLDRGRFNLVHVISGYLMGPQTIAAARARALPVVLTLTEYWFLCARLNLLQPLGTLCTGPDSTAQCVRCLAEVRRRCRLPSRFASPLADAYWWLRGRLGASSPAWRDVEARQGALRVALESASAVISPSRFLADTFATCGVETRDFHLIRQGLTSARPADVAAASRPPGPLRLGYLGQLKPHKGVDLLVRAVRDVNTSGRAVELQIWGSRTEDPAHVGELERLAGGDPAIQWRGQYRGAEVWRVLDHLDVVVLPSRWYENSPNIILEAHAAGRPTVVTNLGGMSELVTHERNGLLFELGSAADLARQLRRLVDEPALLDQLCAGIPHVKSLDEEMREILEIYGSLAAMALPPAAQKTPLALQ